MKSLKNFIPLMLVATMPLGALAELPGKHPFYLHALSDLRVARWLIEQRPGDAKVSGDEDVAITRIDEAIREIKKAAVEDGKNVNVLPPVDITPDRRGRLHRAEQLLRSVRSDISREEDDPLTQGLRDHAVHQVDGALHATSKAIHDAEATL